MVYMLCEVRITSASSLTSVKAPELLDLGGENTVDSNAQC